MKFKRTKWVTGRRKRVVVAVLMLMIFAVLGGCATDTTIPDQVLAIETAIDERLKSTEEFYYFEYDDLTAQVTDALEQKEKKLEEYQYTIEVWVADVKTLPEDPLEVPDIPYDLSTEPHDYLIEYTQALTDIIENYIVTAELEDMVQTKLTVKLTRVEETWKAEFLDSEFTELCKNYKQEIESKTIDMAIATDSHSILRFTYDVKAVIKETLNGTIYDDALKLQSVDKDGDKYTVTVEYPDFTEEFDGIVDKVYGGYAENGKRFDKLSEEDATRGINQALTERKAEIPVQSLTLEMAYATVISEEFKKIKDDFDVLCKEKAISVVEKVNQELVHQPQEKPGTQVLSGDNSGQSITVETSADLYDLHISFYALSGTDLSEEGTKSLSAYIKAGDSLTVYLPAGNYKLVQGNGEEWYGDELSFGPNGDYTVSDLLIQIEYGYEYTLMLYGVEDGNMPTTDIPFPYAA